MNQNFEKHGVRQLYKLSWPYLWSIFLALGWLLPNHYLPWITFHNDAWIAGMFLLAGTAVVICHRAQLEWTNLSITAALTVLIPVLQYTGGLLIFSGQVWITSAYLLGLLLSLLLGAHWERYQPGQAFDALFLAIGLACILSVGMQLYQWLGLSGFDPWIVNIVGNRPFANLVQPNQMATLLLWGLISVGWFSHHKYIGSVTGVFIAMFFLLGIALTQSRTPILTIILCLLGGWYLRTIWYTRKRLWIVAGLILFFVICIVGIGPISNSIFLNERFDVVDRITSGNIRLSAYSLFVDAILQRPYFGYGWTNLGAAQMQVAENHIALGDVFQHAHNLLLDLMLWTGIPIGILIFGVLLRWLYFQFKGIARIEDILLVFFVVVFFVHAMLELPHQYAYILLPIGLVMGGMGVRAAVPIWFRTGSMFFAVLLLSAACLFGFVVRDYFRMETDFMALRFERSYGRTPPEVVPKTLVLSQLEAFIKMGRLKAHPGMSQDELHWMRDVVGYFPSPANQYLYIAALALNGYSVDAYKRMNILQKVMSFNDYEELGKLWFAQGKTNVLLAKTKWLPIVEAHK